MPANLGQNWCFVFWPCLANDTFGQFVLCALCVLCLCHVCVVLCVVCFCGGVQDFRGCSPGRPLPRTPPHPHGPPSPDRLPPDRPKFRFFFRLPPHFLSFSLLEVLSLNFWGCLKRRGLEMCTLGVLGLSCEAPAAPKPTHNNTQIHTQTTNWTEKVEGSAMVNASSELRVATWLHFLQEDLNTVTFVPVLAMLT